MRRNRPGLRADRGLDGNRVIIYDRLMTGNQSITEPGSTRDRLVAAGMALIAERGFNGVSVGEIEAAVGLVPRRGALYKHFPSKQALVEAALEERIAGVADMSFIVDWFASDDARADPRGTLLAAGRAVLDELDREKHLNQIIEKDGDRFPELRDRMRSEVIEPGFRYAEESFTSWIETRASSNGSGAELDGRVVAAVLLSALVHHRRQQWLFGHPPHDVDTEQFLDGWVSLALRALDIREVSP